jgi:hypothetical protein
MEQIKHKHHIIPRHVGGSDDPSNIIELTIQEHAEAHRKLYEEHGRWQDKLAWQALTGMIPHEQVLYEAVKNRDTSYMKQSEFRDIMKNATKKAWAEGKMDNRTYSEEGLKKIKGSSSEVGKRVHRQKIENDWHRNGPGR